MTVPTETPDVECVRCLSCRSALPPCPECEDYSPGRKRPESAPTETPSLTTEQARGLASRWAGVQRAVEFANYCRDNPIGARLQLEMTGGEGALTCQPLTDSERERLFAWVRARMARTVGTQPNVREDWAGDVADDLGLWDAAGECPRAWALCEAAGWPS